MKRTSYDSPTAKKNIVNLKTAFETVEVLCHASPASLAALAAFGRLRRVRKGEHIFLDREEIADVYFLVEGSLTLYKISSLGERRVIFTLEPGKMVNDVILDDLSTSINCEALEDSTILRFDSGKFLAVMEQDFALTKAVIGSLSLKVRRLYRQLKNTSGSLRGDKRIAAKLWKLSADRGVPCADGVRIDMKLSVTYLADMLGSKRETVSRQLKSLCEQGLVVVKDHVFLIPDRDKLARFFKE